MNLKRSLEKMMLIRAFEEEVDRLFAAGELGGTTHLCVGQEAVAVGACSALGREDLVVSNHRGHGHLLARGGQPDRMMAELFGRSGGYSRGLGGSQHVSCLEEGFLASFGLTGQGIPIAAGAALASVMKGPRRVVLVFFGDGAANTGACHEAMNMASLWQLPLVLVCENNGYAMSTPFHASTRVDNLACRAAAYAMPGSTVDGNDLEAVHKAVSTARRRALGGKGPSLIECVTYRCLGHSRSDRREYRTREEEALWKKRDPIVLLERRLRRDGLLSAEETEKLRRRAAEAVSKAVDFARLSPELSLETYLKERLD